MSIHPARVSIFRALVSAAILLTIPQLPAMAAPVPMHVSNAETLLSDLTVSKRNVYGKNPSYVQWQGTTSQARTVCSTFLTLLLEHTYGLTDSTFSMWMGNTGQLAKDYHDAIAAQHNYTPIDDIRQVVPGDIIAIKYPPGGANTGHVMLAVEAPKLMSATTPTVAGTTQYAITVIDSSSLNHGPTDTRITNPSTTGNGIGKGTFRVYVDAGQKPVGWTHGTQPHDTYYSMSQRHLVIGRVNHLGAGSALPPNDGTPGSAPPPSPGAGMMPNDSPASATPASTSSDPDTGLTDGEDNPMAQAAGCTVAAHAPIEMALPTGLLALALALFLGLRRRRQISF